MQDLGLGGWLGDCARKPPEQGSPARCSKKVFRKSWNLKSSNEQQRLLLPPQSVPQAGRQEANSALKSCSGSTAECGVAGAAAAILGKAGLGLRQNFLARAARLLRDDRLLLGELLQLQPASLPGKHLLGLDGEEGCKVQIKHCHPSAWGGGVLAALGTRDPPLLIGHHIEAPDTGLAKRMAAVEAAREAGREVIAAVADDALEFEAAGTGDSGLRAGLGSLIVLRPRRQSSPAGRNQREEPFRARRGPDFGQQLQLVSVATLSSLPAAEGRSSGAASECPSA